MLWITIKHGPTRRDKIGLRAERSISIRSTMVTSFRINIDTARETLMTLIQHLAVLMTQEPTLMEVMPTVSRAHILITIQKLVQRKELTLKLSRRDTGGTESSKKNCQDQLEKVKLMLVRDTLVPFQEPNQVSFIARVLVLNVMIILKSQSLPKLSLTSRKVLIQKPSKSLRRSLRKLRPRKKKRKRRVKRKLLPQEKKKNQPPFQSNQSSPRRPKSLRKLRKSQPPSCNTDQSTITRSTTDTERVRLTVSFLKLKICE